MDTTRENADTADEESQAVRRRMSEWRGSFQPSSAEDEWLFAQMVASSVRVDRCQRDESALRSHLADRASVCWDDDRRLAAEETAASLSKKPALTSRRLRRTRQGCEWLLDRWRSLGRVFDHAGSWTDAQTSLALDLLGTPLELRDGPAPASPPDLVAREVARLERLKADALDALDADEQSAAEIGLEIEPGRPLALLRRFEAACLRRFQWARNRLRDSARKLSAPAPLPVAPAPLPLPLSAPTDADWKAYDREIFGRLMAAKKAEALAQTPVVPIVATPSAPLATDRQPRRAAETPAAMGR